MDGLVSNPDCCSNADDYEECIEVSIWTLFYKLLANKNGHFKI